MSLLNENYRDEPSQSTTQSNASQNSFPNASNNQNLFSPNSNPPNVNQPNVNSNQSSNSNNFNPQVIKKKLFSQIT
jgi:hypothetical protein